MIPARRRLDRSARAKLGTPLLPKSPPIFSRVASQYNRRHRVNGGARKRPAPRDVCGVRYALPK